MTAFAPRDRSRHPRATYNPYRSTRLRAPQHGLLRLPTTPTEEAGPVFGHGCLGPGDDDLITNFAAPGAMAIGPRIRVHGRVQDEGARPVSGALIEIWQANAGGRYRHRKEGYLAPLDPNFGGCGRVITDADGHFSFMTIHPGAYPWPNGGNDWRPAHIHFSIFGHAFAQRLVTQMYFEGDPLIKDCPIVKSISDDRAIESMIATLDLEGSEPMDHLAYRFDITLRGTRQTVFENRPEGL